MKYSRLVMKPSNIYEPREQGKPYSKLSSCHFKIEQERSCGSVDEFNWFICGSVDLCDHKGWPTLCKDHCNKW